MRKYLTCWVKLMPVLLLLLLPSGVFAGIAPGTFGDCVAGFNTVFADYMDEEDLGAPDSTKTLCGSFKGAVFVERGGTLVGGDPILFSAETLTKPLRCKGDSFVDGSSVITFGTTLTRSDFNKWKKFLKDAGCGVTLNGGKTVFHTSAIFKGGDLVAGANTFKGKSFSGTSGVEAGDFICNKLASKAGLSGTYTAWLSFGATSAKNRVTQVNYPYVLVDGTRVVDDFNALINTTNVNLLSAIIRDENGDVSNAFAWTGTNSDGTFRGDTCGNWQNEAASGRVGRVNFSNTAWTSAEGRSCVQEHTLYCFQD